MFFHKIDWSISNYRSQTYGYKPVMSDNKNEKMLENHIAYCGLLHVSLRPKTVTGHIMAYQYNVPITYLFLLSVLTYSTNTNWGVIFRNYV